MALVERYEVGYQHIRFVPTNCYSPAHDFVKSWVFSFEDKGQEEIDAMQDALLADAVARVAERNGLSRNDVQHMFPLILRMLKSKSEWTK